ncbi:unnamed protein product [Mytilus coruscus]|uniref:SAP domain-containing protein n=1 Tax=Mytilus coruscus TaxID=42192 RepID=A0A6J8C7F7_MYTCO|nr:unnamed protein product [Mytilus coruscus]
MQQQKTFEDIIRNRLKPEKRCHSVSSRFDLDVYRYCFQTDELGQPTTKVNDDIKAIHHQKTNRYDCAMDALKVRKSDYWEDDIRVIRSRRKFCAAIKDADVISASKPCLDDEDDVKNLTMVEIKQKLQDHGVATKIRKHDKLFQLYKDTVLQNHS